MIPRKKPEKLETVINTCVSIINHHQKKNVEIPQEHGFSQMEHSNFCKKSETVCQKILYYLQACQVSCILHDYHTFILKHTFIHTLSNLYHLSCIFQIQIRFLKLSLKIKKRFPNEYYIVPPYMPALFVSVILVSFILQTKVTGFGHSLFYILNLGSVFYCKCTKKNPPFRFLVVDLQCMCAMKRKLKTFGNSSRSVSQG